jgi:hypothetical protein
MSRILAPADRCVCGGAGTCAACILEYEAVTKSSAELRVRFRIGGNVCAECAERVQRYACDGDRLMGWERLRLDGVVGRCGNGCRPEDSHRYEWPTRRTQ